jgi:uncharacterized protein DUF4390
MRSVSEFLLTLLRTSRRRAAPEATHPLGGRTTQRVGLGAVLSRRLALLVLLGAAGASVAQGIELLALHAARNDGELTLDYQARLALTPAIEDALKRGVPLYFVAQAAVYRGRWYWRDERLARVSRTWRVSYQPLTSSWRVALGGLAQAYPSLAEALATLSQVSGWRLMDADRLDSGERHYVEFSLQLDRTQLPQPMQIEVGNDWKLAIERTLRIE